MLFLFAVRAKAQQSEMLYKKDIFMIPMRDGANLFAVLLYPANTNKPCPC